MTTGIKAATTGSYKILGDFLRSNPNYLITNPNDVFEYPLHHQGADPEVHHV